MMRRASPLLITNLYFFMENNPRLLKWKIAVFFVPVNMILGILTFMLEKRLSSYNRLNTIGIFFASPFQIYNIDKFLRKGRRSVSEFKKLRLIYYEWTVKADAFTRFINTSTPEWSSSTSRLAYVKIEPVEFINSYADPVSTPSSYCVPLSLHFRTSFTRQRVTCLTWIFVLVYFCVCCQDYEFF